MVEGERLVAFGGRARRVRVHERREAVRPSRRDRQDVVGFRALELHFAYDRTCPYDSVAALGHACKIAMRFAGRPCHAIGGAMGTVVVHPAAVAVLQHRCVAAAVAFVRHVVRQGDLTRLRMMDLKPDSVRRRDKLTVEKQLPRVAHGHGGCGDGGSRMQAARRQNAVHGIHAALLGKRARHGAGEPEREPGAGACRIETEPVRATEGLRIRAPVAAAHLPFCG